MSGTREGGLKAAITNRERHGDDFYAIQGAKGGKKGHTGGFAANVECWCSDIPGLHYKRECAGAKGGRISKRGKAVRVDE